MGQKLRASAKLDGRNVISRRNSLSCKDCSRDHWSALKKFRAAKLSDPCDGHVAYENERGNVLSDTDLDPQSRSSDLVQKATLGEKSIPTVVVLPCNEDEQDRVVRSRSDLPERRKPNVRERTACDIITVQGQPGLSGQHPPLHHCKRNPLHHTKDSPLLQHGPSALSHCWRRKTIRLLQGKRIRGKKVLAVISDQTATCPGLSATKKGRHRLRREKQDLQLENQNFQQEKQDLQLENKIFDVRSKPFFAPLKHRVNHTMRSTNSRKFRASTLSGRFSEKATKRTKDDLPVSAEKIEKSRQHPELPHSPRIRPSGNVIDFNNISELDLTDCT
jgi:hypothetical protein